MQMEITALPTDALGLVLAQLCLVRNIKRVKSVCKAFRAAATAAETGIPSPRPEPPKAAGRCRIGTLNVRTLAGRVALLVEIFLRHDLDILLLQEVHLGRDCVPHFTTYTAAPHPNIRPMSFSAFAAFA